MGKSSYKFVILGGGLSGLSTAYTLKDDGDILVVEKEKIVGGLARNISRNGDNLDLGSHRLHHNNGIYDFFRKKLGLKLCDKERGSQLFLKGGFIRYPINSLDLFTKINFFKSIFSLISSIYYKLFSRKNSFEGKARSRVGNYIYKVFYRDYARKVWNIKLDKLSSSVLKSRFSLNIIKILKQVFVKKVKKYVYIKGGLGKGISEKYKLLLEQSNIDLITGKSEYEIELKNNKIIIDGLEIKYEKIISTIPLDDFLLLSGNKKLLESNFLSYRGLFLFYMYFDKEVLEKGETFYFPSKKFIFGRVSVPKRFDENIQNGSDYTVLCLEIPGNSDEFSDEEILKKSYSGLIDSGLINKKFKIDKKKTFLMHQKNVYPMYKIGWEDNIKMILIDIHSKYNNLYISGRQGLFLHCNMDHSFDLGKELGNHILDSADNKEWLKNIDKYFNFIVRD